MAALASIGASLPFLLLSETLHPIFFLNSSPTVPNVRKLRMICSFSTSKVRQRGRWLSVGMPRKEDRELSTFFIQHFAGAHVSSILTDTYRTWASSWSDSFLSDNIEKRQRSIA